MSFYISKFYVCSYSKFFKYLGTLVVVLIRAIVKVLGFTKKLRGRFRKGWGLDRGGKSAISSLNKKDLKGYLLEMHGRP